MSFLQPPEQTETAPAPPDPTTNETEGQFGTNAKPPKPPVVDENASADDVKTILSKFIEDQQKWRSDLVRDVRAAQIPPPPPSQGDSSDQRAEARAAEIAKHPFYCPTCGMLHDYLRECVGPRGFNHPPVVVAKTDELQNAPNPLDKDAYATYQAGHTQDPNDPALAVA